MTHGKTRETLAGFLYEAELSHLVGREKELRNFLDDLDQSNQDLHIYNLYGPAGIGKSVLLNSYQKLANDRQITFIRLEGELIQGSIECFEEQLLTELTALNPALDKSFSAALDFIHQMAATSKVVIAVDSYDLCLGLNRFLVEKFFSELPKHTLLVIVSRHPLEHIWSKFHSWKRWIKPVPLHKFNKQEVSAYFESHGIHDPNLLDIAIRYTQGHPLALSLFLLMAQREGTESVTKLSERADLIEELLTRWLSELNDPQLQHLLETASVAHQFDLSLLSSLVEGEVDEDSFDELAKLPFIYRVGDSWIMHDSAREVLSRGIRSRQPAQYRKLRVLCLEYFANLATGPGTEQERKMALENVYALIGDTLVRGAMFKSTQHAENLYLEPAVLADLPDLQAYMDEWRDGRNQSASSPLEIRDHNGQLIQNEWILAESQEPDYIDIQSILTLMPGAFQILKDSKQRIHGISIVFPINAATIDYLKHQAVTRHFFQSLDKHELQSYMQAPQNTDSAFLRLIDVRDQNDHSAREVLIRNLVGLLLKPMRFVTSTPLRFYQALLSRFGFEVRNGILHYEFGDDRPSPYFVLDVRKIPLVTRLKEMIMAQSGNSGITEQDEPREEERKDSDIFFKLTTREKEVAEAAIEGLANCSIAARLDVSEITIKKHMSRIFEKTGTRNRNQLIQKYWKLAGSKQAENEHN